MYDVIVLKGVSHLFNAPNLISTGKLNKHDLNVNAVDDELSHIKGNMHKYNMKFQMMTWRSYPVSQDL
jgi:hypothetical protein